MRIGFRHCLLSSCLFRCGAGSLRGAAEPGGSAGASAWVADTAPMHSPAPTQPCSHPALPLLPWGPALEPCTSLPMSPEPSPGVCHRAGFCRPPQPVPACQDLGGNIRINVNKCNRMVQCHRPVMKSSGRWAGWWEEMGYTVVFLLLLLLLGLPVAY